MKLRSLALGAVMAFVLPSMVCLVDDARADDTKCRASRKLLDLGHPLEVARNTVADKKELRIIAMGSSSTQGYGASNPAFAYPAQLKMTSTGFCPALPCTSSTRASAARTPRR
jgi:hypothetical protein